MGAEMRLLRFTKLLLVALPLIAVIHATNAEGEFTLNFAPIRIKLPVLDNIIIIQYYNNSFVEVGRI